METNTEDYKKHLEEKYLPGRDFYLNHFFYPKILGLFSNETITDLGFGTGAFLRYLKSKNRDFRGVDSNPFLVKLNREQGFEVDEDDVTVLSTIKTPIKNAICDNVLEHLDLEQINSFFKVCKEKFAKDGTLVVIVPDEKGYQRDPTHKTFVTPNIIKEMCSKHNINFISNFCHPFNSRGMGKILYLNMQVFVMKF